MRSEERAVAQIIEAIRPTCRMEYSVEQSHGECDFVLRDGEGAYPFEVTRYTNPRAQEIYAAIEGRDGTGAFVNRRLAQHDWWVFPTHITNIRRVRDHVDRLLADVEAEGFTQFDVRTDTASPAVQRMWQEIRILHGVQMPWSPPGRIGIATPGDGATLSSDQVVSAVEAEAAKPDNRKKLGLEAAERHLCVYVDYLGYPAHSVMLNGMLPSQHPRLPPEVTHLWVMCDHAEGPEYVVWSYERTAGWQDHGVYVESSEPEQPG
jgi:hypothetical protein